MSHKGLEDLYKNVTSGKFGLERFSLLHSLMDHTLYHVNGNLLEVGLGETTISTTMLSEKYNRKCYCVDYSRSLIENMKNTNGYFGENSIVYRGKSDDFFNETKLTPIAFAFIDGSHEYEDVKNDFYNTLKYLVDDGIIALHDTLPLNSSWTYPEKCGTVYLLRRELEQDSRLDLFTFPFSSFNVGLTIIKRRPNRNWEVH